QNAKRGLARTHGEEALWLAKAVQDFVLCIEHEASRSKFRHQTRADRFPNLFLAFLVRGHNFERRESASAVRNAGGARDAADRRGDAGGRVAALFENAHLGVHGLESI